MSEQREPDHTEDPRKIDEGSGGYPEDTPEETDPQDEGRDAGEEDV